MAGRREVLDDMRAAIRTGRKPVHDGRWGKATVEVALAILRSAREGREVVLEHQVAVDDSGAIDIEKLANPAPPAPPLEPEHDRPFTTETAIPTATATVTSRSSSRTWRT